MADIHSWCRGTHNQYPMMCTKDFGYFGQMRWCAVTTCCCCCGRPSTTQRVDLLLLLLLPTMLLRFLLPVQFIHVLARQHDTHTCSILTFKRANKTFTSNRRHGPANNCLRLRGTRIASHSTTPRPSHVDRPSPSGRADQRRQ